MKKLRILIICVLVSTMSGCAGLFIAGAATAVYVVTDPRSSSELANDQNVSLQVGALGNKSPYQFNVRVTANTFRGNVLLMGQAVSQDYLDQVETDVRKITGVKVVYNQMKVKPLLSIGAISKDTWITTKVKSALLADNELREIKITVYTEDTEVFLVGALSPYHADKAVEIARNISGVTRVIRAFYYGDDPEAQRIQQQQQGEILSNNASSENKTTLPTSSSIQADKTDSNDVIEEDIPYIVPIEE